MGHSFRFFYLLSPSFHIPFSSLLLLYHPFLRFFAAFPLPVFFSRWFLSCPFFSWISHQAQKDIFTSIWENRQKLATEQPLQYGQPFTTSHHVSNHAPRRTLLLHPSPPIKASTLAFPLICLKLSQKGCVLARLRLLRAETELSDVIVTKILRIFLLAIHSHL